MKTIQDIITNYGNGDYTTKLEYPTERKLPPIMIIDENQTVKWNKEQVAAHNKAIDDAKQAVVDDSNKLYSQLRMDVVEALQTDYDLTKEQADVVESYTYQEYHSSTHDYLNNLYDTGEFAVKLLKAGNTK